MQKMEKSVVLKEDIAHYYVQDGRWALGQELRALDQDDGETHGPGKVQDQPGQ